MKKDSKGYYRETGTYRGERYDFRAKTRDGLRQKVDAFKKSIDTGVVSSSMTVEQWGEKWLTTYKLHTVGAKGYRDYTGCLKNHIYPAIGRRKVQDIRPADLQAILNELSGSNSQGVKIRQTMKQMFRAARQNKIIIDDPAEELTLPKLASGSHRSITPAERELILRTCETHFAGNWVLIMLFCGLRPAEAAALQWVDVDIPRRIVHVTKSLNQETGEIKSTKTAAGVRDVPMPEELVRRLKPGNPFDYVALTVQGRRVHDGASMRRAWSSFRREMEKQGGAKFYRNRIVISVVADDLTPYCLRHTYCTDLQAAGVPINVARELMGHTNISITASIYTHHSDESIQRAVDLLNAAQDGTNDGTNAAEGVRKAP